MIQTCIGPYLRKWSCGKLCIHHSRITWCPRLSSDLPMVARYAATPGAFAQKSKCENCIIHSCSKELIVSLFLPLHEARKWKLARLLVNRDGTSVSRGGLQTDCQGAKVNKTEREGSRKHLSAVTLGLGLVSATPGHVTCWPSTETSTANHDTHSARGCATSWLAQGRSLCAKSLFFRQVVSVLFKKFSVAEGLTATERHISDPTSCPPSILRLHRMCRSKLSLYSVHNKFMLINKSAYTNGWASFEQS